MHPKPQPTIAHWRVNARVAGWDRCCRLRPRSRPVGGVRSGIAGPRRTASCSRAAGVPSARDRVRSVCEPPRSDCSVRRLRRENGRGKKGDRRVGFRASPGGLNNGRDPEPRRDVPPEKRIGTHRSGAQAHGRRSHPRNRGNGSGLRPADLNSRSAGHHPRPACLGSQRDQPRASPPLSPIRPR